MQSLDTHRLKLQQLAASLKAWSGFVADVARVEAHDVGRGWRLSLQPEAAGACPLELVLDGEEASCDLRVGSQVVEGWRLPSLDIVLPMVEAVAEGRVVTHRTFSAVTGLPIGVVTEVTLADGRKIELPARDAATEQNEASAVETRDRHYVPYRKPNGKAG
jgi:hypothetical protein